MVRVGGAQRHSQGQRSVDSKPGKETQRWRHAVGGSERRGCEEKRLTGQRGGGNAGTRRRRGTETAGCRDALRHVERAGLKSP